MVGRCCDVFLTAVHLPTTRKGGLRGKVDCLLLFTRDWKRNRKACAPSKVFEGGEEQGLTGFIHVIRARPFHRSNFLSQNNRWGGREDRKKQLFYFLRVDALEVEGRSWKLSTRKRNQQAAKSPARAAH